MKSELACTVMFGAARGAEIVELVERVTGAACPCKQGAPCPLVATLGVPQPRRAALTHA